MLYAYCRIMAGDEESLNRLNVIRDMQVLEENIFLDYPTKEKRSRIQYNKLIKLLKENDLLYVSSFTALGDGYKEVEEQWRFLTKTKKVDIVLIDMPDIDTRKGKSNTGIQKKPITSGKIKRYQLKKRLICAGYMRLRFIEGRRR